MKKLFIVLAVFAFAMTSCGSKANDSAKTAENGEVVKKKGGTKIKTTSDSISYALGVDYANYLVRMRDNLGEDFNQKMVINAIRDVMNEKGSLDPEESFKVMQSYFTVVLPERNRVDGEKFLADVEKQANVKKTSTGLLYEIIKPGSAKKAMKVEDEVKVLYKGTLKNGKEFDGNYESGDTARFALNRVIKGWGEGLQLVGEGGKIKLWIPAEMGYGERGGGQIGPNEPLVFEVDVLEVIPAVAAEETPAADAAKK